MGIVIRLNSKAFRAPTPERWMEVQKLGRSAAEMLPQEAASDPRAVVVAYADLAMRCNRCPPREVGLVQLDDAFEIVIMKPRAPWPDSALAELQLLAQMTELFDPSVVCDVSHDHLEGSVQISLGDAAALVQRLTEEGRYPWSANPADALGEDGPDFEDSTVEAAETPGNAGDQVAASSQAEIAALVATDVDQAGPAEQVAAESPGAEKSTHLMYKITL